MTSSWPRQFYNNRVKVSFPSGLVHFGELTAKLTINNDPNRLSYEITLDKPWQDQHKVISVPTGWVTSEQPE